VMATSSENVGRKQELEPWHIHRIMGEVDMYLHGWRAKVRALRLRFADDWSLVPL